MGIPIPNWKKRMNSTKNLTLKFFVFFQIAKEMEWQEINNIKKSTASIYLMKTNTIYHNYYLILRVDGRS